MMVLYFRLDADLFERIHGPILSALVRSDLNARLEAAASLLLRRHRRATRLVSPAYGVWGALFELGETGFAADEAERVEALEAAARELALDAMDKELGTAVAIHMKLDAGVRPWSGPVANEEALKGWLQRLAAEPMPRRAADAAVRRHVTSALERRALSTLLQPIVSLPGGRITGFEALGRGPDGALHSADRLFAAAAACGLRPRLELALLDSALALAPRLPQPLWLAVNLSPARFSEDAVRRIAETPGLPERLVLEVTEHLPIEAPMAFARLIAPLRRAGARLAFDDAGCGFLDIDLAHALKPDIVKLCITVTSRLGRGGAALGEVEGAVTAIRAAGALALAEGVETEQQAGLAAACGFSLAQGYWFGRPVPAERALEKARRPAGAAGGGS